MAQSSAPPNCAPGAEAQPLRTWPACPLLAGAPTGWAQGPHLPSAAPAPPPGGRLPTQAPRARAPLSPLPARLASQHDALPTFRGAVRCAPAPGPSWASVPPAARRLRSRQTWAHVGGGGRPGGAGRSRAASAGRRPRASGAGRPRPGGGNQGLFPGAAVLPGVFQRGRQRRSSATEPARQGRSLDFQASLFPGRGGTGLRRVTFAGGHLGHHVTGVGALEPGSAAVPNSATRWRQNRTGLRRWGPPQPPLPGGPGG